jgi:adenine-specific DNA-methyltransferase
MAKVQAKTRKTNNKQAKNYRHPESENVMRPDVGTQAQFKKKLPPKKYRYDDSLSPSLEWDGQSPARERGEALIREILDAKTIEDAKSAASKLKAMSSPFLNWAGKAERMSFEVPTLPLFIHERLSTKAILETLKGHRRDKQTDMFDLFGDPQHPIHEQILRAYEHKDKWVNRMILGDSLVVMNSLLQYEGLGGQVQMIYIDPPYGVKFGSNFQPFVRRKDVGHGDDEDMTREPEMVQAYRDTWELGLHSYLTYFKDRLLLARELLTASGSVFVQISDENFHHLRELMDDVFGPENFCAAIEFAKTSGLQSKLLYQVCDFILWYARDKSRVKYNQLYTAKIPGEVGASKYDRIELPNGERRSLSKEERDGTQPLPIGARYWVDGDLTSQGNPLIEFEYNGKRYTGTYKTNIEGLKRLAQAKRIYEAEGTLRFIRYLDDFPSVPLTTAWMDIGGIQSRTDPKIYVVQTAPKAVERCLLMSSDPGDLVLDITCGSGTTAYVAEQWGRRWLTTDTSRVPLALARQRLPNRHVSLVSVAR